MTATQIRDIDVCVFDAYGTLFDYASAAMRCKDALAADWVAVSDLWRRKQLEYTWLRSLMGRHADFWHVTGESLDYALAAFNREDPSVYQIIVDALAVAPNRVCFMSSNGWDAAGAAAFGFRTVWVNRGKQPMENLPAHPEAVLPSLAELPALLGL
ncbi:MAG TPA: HAD-IA family hydrolase [Alphaproteobacteria bacterium]|nr:HAD-IA family hydrolase [Alphaproteobacteria bacterium]